MTEILGIKDPDAFNRGNRLKQHVRRLAAEMEIDGAWDLEVAAMLSQIGFAVVPSDIVERARAGEALSEGEQQLFDSHASVARDLLSHIPRLEEVADMIGSLGGSGSAAEPRVALGVRLLNAAADYDGFLQTGMAEGAAVAAMRHADEHSEEILKALDLVAVASGGYVEKSLGVADLVSGPILAADLYSTDDRLLLSEGTELSLAARTRIAQYADHVGVREPALVRVPV